MHSVEIQRDAPMHSAGDARSLSGDGGLSPEAPGDEPHDT